MTLLPDEEQMSPLQQETLSNYKNNLQLTEQVIELDGAYLRHLEQQLTAAYLTNTAPDDSTIQLMDNLRNSITLHLHKRRMYRRRLARLCVLHGSY